MPRKVISSVKPGIKPSKTIPILKFAKFKPITLISTKIKPGSANKQARPKFRKTKTPV